MLPANNSTTPGLVGWAAQGAPSRAAAPGLVGWVALGQATAAAAPGLVGWVAQQAANLHLTVLLPPTQAPADADVPLTLTVRGADPAERQALAYAAPGQYALSVPPGVPLTLALASPRYVPSQQPLLLAPGQVLALTVQLAFRAPTKRRRRYRPG